MGPIAAELWSRAQGATYAEILAAAGLSIGMVVATAGLTAVALVRLPEDYFVAERQPLPLEGRPAWLRIGARLFRNVIGAALVLLGILLSLPGVPGQGVLTVLLGLMLMDLPGKRRFEKALVRRRTVHLAINKLRRRFDKPPIQVPGPEPRTGDLKPPISGRVA